MRRGLLVAAICPLLVGFAAAQDCLTRKVLINIANRDFQRVVGIDAANLRGTFRGKPVQVLQLANMRSAPRVVVLLDTSGSMRDGKDAQLAAILINSVLSFLPTETEVAVSGFSDQLSEPLSFERDRQKANEKIICASNTRLLCTRAYPP